MKKILILAESINKNQSSEGIATVNFINAIDTDVFDVICVFYEFPQFELSIIDWINPKVKLIHIKNNSFDVFFSKFSKVKNFFSKYYGVSLLKEYRVYRFRKFLDKNFNHFKFDLIFSRTVATSICSHRALISSTISKYNKTLIYFNDPVPFSLMPFPYSNGISFNPLFDKKEIAHVKNIIKYSTAIASPSMLLNNFFLNLLNDFKKSNFTFPHLYLNSNINLDIDISNYLDLSKINITHCGSLLIGRDPSCLISSIVSLFKEFPEFKNKVSINFFGPIFAGHMKYIESLDHDFIRVINKRFSHEESLALMYQSSLPVLIEAAAVESPFMPVKLAELIGISKPFLVLSPKKSEVRRILGEEYDLQTEVNNSKEIIRILRDFLFNYIDLDKNRTHIFALKPYVSSEFVNNSLQNVISELS